MKLCKDLLGQKVKVVKLKMPTAEKVRLKSLGIDENMEIILEKLSAFGSSFLIRVGNLRVIMRSELAEMIEVTNV